MPVRCSRTWRSLLYVPAHQDRFIKKAHTRGADAIILDLEDGVPEGKKAGARETLSEAIASVGQNGADVLVRINREWSLAWRDIEASIAPGVTALVLPKVENGARIVAISEAMDELERERQLEFGHIGLILLVESARGVLEASRLTSSLSTSSLRICALLLGTEDFAADLGVTPTPEHMLYAKLQVLMTARAIGAIPLGLIGSGAEFEDLDGYRQLVESSRRWGFEGATCIHPSQVPVLNEGFTPTTEEVSAAREVIKAFEEAAGAPTRLGGRMVDRPVYQRALRVVQKAARRSYGLST